MQAALNAFADANGMTITYTGSRDFEGEVGTKVEGGSPPDIGKFPQPGSIAGYARSGDALPLPDDMLANASANWPTRLDGVRQRRRHQYGMPIKTDLKSLVWYMPVGVRRERLQGADDVRRLPRPHPADDRRRPHPAVRGHRVRRGHRLAVHRLGGGLRAAQPGHRLLQPVGRPRDPVQLARDRRGHATGRRPVGRATRCTPTAARSRRRVRRPTAQAARRRRLHDAPPGELLRRRSSPREQRSATARAR